MWPSGLRGLRAGLAASELVKGRFSVGWKETGPEEGGGGSDDDEEEEDEKGHMVRGWADGVETEGERERRSEKEEMVREKKRMANDEDKDE